MLEYLVTSKVRRRLLLLLWGEKKQGSVAELAELADVAFASAHVEVKAMQQAQLVESHKRGAKDVYAANVAYPDADLLRALVATEARRPAMVVVGDESLKRKLVGLGAPLRGVKRLDVARSERLVTLVHGVALARRDPVVARSLPLCFWSLRDSLHAKDLAELAPRPEDRHAVGFFLELTSELGGDRRLLGVAESLRDRRMTSLREFFFGPASGRHAPERAFALAEKWGFQMNTDLDAFRALFDKFVTR